MEDSCTPFSIVCPNLSHPWHPKLTNLSLMSAWSLSTYAVWNFHSIWYWVSALWHKDLTKDDQASDTTKRFLPSPFLSLHFKGISDIFHLLSPGEYGLLSNNSIPVAHPSGFQEQHFFCISYLYRSKELSKCTIF